MVATLENGEDFLRESTGTSQTTLVEDGPRRSNTEEGAEVWTGEAGRYKGVNGFQRNHSAFDIDKRLNQRRSEAEYWFEK
jgi:hypothetical protein